MTSVKLFFCTHHSVLCEMKLEGVSMNTTHFQTVIIWPDLNHI